MVIRVLVVKSVQMIGITEKKYENTKNKQNVVSPKTFRR